MIYGEILAGGMGTRMGNTEKPKQFLMLGDKPIVIHTLEQFLMNPQFDKVLLVVPHIWMEYTKDIVDKYLPQNEKVVIVEGGSSRNETIMNGCKYLKVNYGLNKDDIIVTHDSVRPFVTQRILDENIAGVKEYGAVDTVIPAVDTIVNSKDGKVISLIPERKEYYQGQTPQSFYIEELMEVYDSLSEKDKSILTDACKIYTIKGKTVGLVKGEAFNLKITTGYDLKLATAIIEGSLNA